MGIGWCLQLMLWIIKTFQKPIHQSDIDQVKRRSSSKYTAYFYDLFKIKIESVRDVIIPSDGFDLPARLYHPNPKNELPIILYFHGGGFVLGGIESYDHFCRRLSKITGCAVLSVGYRLAPEYKFPAAHDDAMASLVWIRATGSSYNLNIGKIFVAGDSAGANLAAFLTFAAKDMEMALEGQILIYPVLDMKQRKRQYFDQFLLGEEGLRWFISNLINSIEDLKDTRLSILANDNFSILPPTLIIKAEYDHLNDEIDEYCAKLENSRIKIRLKELPHTFHGFVTMSNWTPEVNSTLEEVNRFVSSD